jgi:hypothetical protein
MDPLTIMALIGGGSSLLGGLFGGSDGQERRAYSGAVSPNKTLQDAMAAIKGFGSQQAQQGPVRLRTTMAPPTRPVQIPGLPFQIGGGLGTDPALMDPSMLMGRGAQAPGQANPMQALFGNSGATGQAGQRGVQPKTPGQQSRPRQPETF